MSTIERFGVSIEEELLTWFDARVQSRGYNSRSEAIRNLIRKEMVNEEWDNPEADVIGTVTIVYEHHLHELAHVMTDVQHQYHDSIVCSTHVHMDAHNCLEVVIVRGNSTQIKTIAETLISTRGVKHGQLVCTTTGHRIR
jgi:CopG family nickel-responsive transcriptional regulator